MTTFTVLDHNDQPIQVDGVTVSCQLAPCVGFGEQIEVPDFPSQIVCGACGHQIIVL